MNWMFEVNVWREVEEKNNTVVEIPYMLSIDTIDTLSSVVNTQDIIELY